MKNACRLIVCITFLLVAGSVYADETCHVSRVTLSGIPHNMVGQILDAFQMNTGNGAPADISCYEIQFVFDAQIDVDSRIRNRLGVTRSFDGSFTYQPDSSDSRPIYISGLNLRQGDDLVLPTDPALGREKSFLNIIGTAGRRVILKDSILANVRQGIFADGDGAVDFDNVTITGDAAKSGPCLSVNAPGATVRTSNFSSCSEGIRLAANNVRIGPTDAARYAEDKNIIHDNTVGISEAPGMTGNRWAFNSLYGNTVGIQSQRVAPALVSDPETGQALRCSTDESGNISQRELRFDGVTGPGEMILYVADGVLNQGRDFLGMCSVDLQGICRLGPLRLTPPLDTSVCGRRELRITAMFNAAQSTDYLADSFIFYGEDVTFVAGPFEIPTSGVAQGGGNTGGGDDDDIADDATSPGDTGNSMSDGANPIDVTSLPESGGAQTLPGASGGAAAVGAKCSLTTTGATLHSMALGLDLWWLILAAIVVGSLRTVKVRIRKK